MSRHPSSLSCTLMSPRATTRLSSIFFDASNCSSVALAGASFGDDASVPLVRHHSAGRHDDTPNRILLRPLHLEGVRLDGMRHESVIRRQTCRVGAAALAFSRLGVVLHCSSRLVRGLTRQAHRSSPGHCRRHTALKRKPSACLAAKCFPVAP